MVIDTLKDPEVTSVAAITPGSSLTDKVLLCTSLSEFSSLWIGRENWEFPVFTL